MAIKLHNTLSKQTEEFTSQEDGKVKLYTCGPTVYDFLTVGNWAAYVYWDTLVRMLKANGYNVERVMNITDVGHLTSDADDGEDKLEKGAKREGKTAWDVAQIYTDDFLNGMKRLNMQQPTHMPRATEYIEQQLDFVRRLKEKGYTYQIDDGIYYDTSKFPRYADFAGLDLEAQRAGARVTFNAEKRNPSDFALWKFTPSGEKRDMEWPTPADLIDDGAVRPGFPGWHLECSAMAVDLLGETLDIHTGGIDHIPVHHTNEIAQSEAVTGKPFSNYWLHNNHLKVDGTKISKSLQNGYTLDDLEKRGFTPLDYRMFVLQGHYRNEGNFTFDNLEAAKNRLQHWRNVAALRHQTDGSGEESQPTVDKIREALNDDLNTPEALHVIDEVFSDIESRDCHTIDPGALKYLLDAIDQMLGLQLVESTPDIDSEQQKLIQKREQARVAKDWAESDELRDTLAEQGVAVRDTQSGTIWEYIQ